MDSKIKHKGKYFYVIRSADGKYLSGFTDDLERLLYIRGKRHSSIKFPLQLFYPREYKHPLKVKMTLRRFIVNGVAVRLYDYKKSISLYGIKLDIEIDVYRFKRIPFKKGDVVIDIGAHVGFVSIYLAKKYPFLKIYSFEPTKDNYEHFKKNIKLNRVKNIKAFNKAVTQDGRKVDMYTYFFNTGAASICSKNIESFGRCYHSVKSITLDDIFRTYHIKKCKVLKIDCEGSEYEILLNTKMLNRVEYLSAEFHYNNYLHSKGYSVKRLYDYCCRFIKKKNIKYEVNHMLE